MFCYIFILYNIVLVYISLSNKIMIKPNINNIENITQYNDYPSNQYYSNKDISFYQQIIHINNQQHIFIDVL
jgi:hypothetical protein